MKIQRLIHLTTLIIIACLSLFFVFNSASARVSGSCVNCHTMHNSQNGSALNSDAIETLLANDCVGCHSSNTSSTTYSLGGCTVPIVHYTGGSAPTEYLAGGNFWWVKENLGGDNSKGHNVFLYEGDEALIGGAPGAYTSGCGSNSCHDNLHWPADHSSGDLEGRWVPGVSS